jgi:4-amino-4-deoxy-L-arabinose transferase-like glycosyltransferase
MRNWAACMRVKRGVIANNHTLPDSAQMTAPSAVTMPHAKPMQVSWQPAAALTALANAFEQRTVHARVTTGEWMVFLSLLCVALTLRFWGLGAHGLEYDEETMAMPVMHILEHGTPAMPSGMTYVRGVVQLYLMAGSALLFGPTEWAFRLPSVLCSAALLLGCFFMGRRFLAPMWNLVFVGVVAFSATMILDAQEARMYVFMLSSLVWATVLVFRWERTGRAWALWGAVALIALGVQFHSLAIFGALPLLFPGLLHGDWRRLRLGVVALIVAGVAFGAIHHWTESFFPPSQPSPEGALVEVGTNRHVYASLAWQFWPVSLLALAAITACAVQLYRAGLTSGRLLACLLISGGLCAQWLFSYHVAMLLYVAGLVVFRRAQMRWQALIPVALLGIVILAVQLYVLHTWYPESIYKTLGRLTGVPSVWIYWIFAGYAPVATLIVSIGAAAALWQLSRSERVDEVWLYAALAVWAPLLLIGLFSWHPQQRYTEGSLIPLYLCAAATVAWACHGLVASRPWQKIALAVAAGAVICNPLATASVVNAGYRIHPDHKGAAEFIASVREPGDILLAEDVLQQTYYLGHVDYWLIGERAAKVFTRDVGGRTLDIYTHTPVITNEQALIARSDRGTIYIIGSGEHYGDGRVHVRGPSLAPLFRAPPWQVAYHGRDGGATKVWSIPPATRSAAAR